MKNASRFLLFLLLLFLMLANGDGYCAENTQCDGVSGLQKNANAGDVEVQTLLGTIYYNGQCVDQDYVKASKWFEKAANQGKVFAQMSLGMIYARGDGVKLDYVKAKEWFKKSYYNGYKRGCEEYKKLK